MNSVSLHLECLALSQPL